MEKPLAGAVICCTSVIPEDRTRYAEYAQQMGADHKLDLTSDVTHLLVGDTDTAKYRYVAKEREDVRVLRPEWVEAVRNRWMEDTSLELEGLYAEYKLPTLQGLKICITGFDDLTFRAQLQKNVVENGGEYTGDLTKDVTHLIAAKPEGKKFEFGLQWQKKVVSLKWYKDSLQRGMQLDESLYNPTRPVDEQGIDEQGKPAWKRHTQPVSHLGKRAQDDNVVPQPPKKLRRTASARLGSQNDNLWTDIVAGEGFDVADDERRVLKPTKSLPSMRPSTSRDATVQQERSFSHSDSVPQSSGYFSGRNFGMHGLDPRRAEIVRTIVGAGGGSLSDSIDAAVRESESDGRNAIMVIAHSYPAEKVPKFTNVDVVTEFWLEWCMFNKAFIAPQDYPLGLPISQTRPQGITKLSVSTTGFTPVERLQMQKLMQLLGGRYEETFTPHVSVLICKEDKSNKEKMRAAEATNVPVVGPRWLFRLLEEGRVPSYEHYRITTMKSIGPRPQQKGHNDSKGLVEDKPSNNPSKTSTDVDLLIVARKSVNGNEDSNGVRPSKEPLSEVSPNSPTKERVDSHTKQKKRLFQTPDGPSSERAEDVLPVDENGKPAIGMADARALNGAIQDLLDMKARSKSSNSEVRADQARKKGLYGRALSNLSNSSAKSNRPRSRASSVDTVNTDGVGSEIGVSLSNKDRSSSSFTGRAQSGLHTGGVSAIELGDLGYYQTGHAEEAEAPALTQLVYDDPEEAIILREKLAARRRQRFRLGQKADDPPPAQQREDRKIRDDDLLTDAGWGAGRRTRHKDKNPPGLKQF